MAVRTHISRHEQARRGKGLSIVALARAAGFSHAYVSRIEGGLIPASARYQTKVEALLEVPKSWLFDSTGRSR